MRLNIYVPDKLGEQVKAASSLNVSTICQDALRAELSRREAADKLAEEMTRIELYLNDRGDVAFTGKEVHYDPDADFTVYVTGRRRIAVHVAENQSLNQYEDFEEFAADLKDRPEAVADVAEAMGEKYVIELDI